MENLKTHADIGKLKLTVDTNTSNQQRASALWISQRIIDYAIWYYLRYFPSTQKLRNKLTEKFGPQSEKWQKYGWIFPEDIDYIISEKMCAIIDEPEVIRSNIRGYINKWKNINYIKSKLYGKLFLKEEYENILQKEFESDTKTLLEYSKLLKQALTLKNKNKPANYIRQKFIERSLDKQIVEDVISELFPDGEWELLMIELLKIIKAPSALSGSSLHEGAEYISEFMQNLDFKQKQKITQKLVGKGFVIGDVIEMMK